MGAPTARIGPAERDGALPASTGRRRSTKAVGRRALAAVGIAVMLGLGACSAPDGAQDPQQRIRQLLEALEAAAEEKDVDGLQGAVAEHYHDARGNDKRAVRRLLTFHMLRNESVHLLTRLHSLELIQPDRARAVVLVAMAGLPLADFDALLHAKVDLHRFDVRLAEIDGDWKIESADWRRAAAEDFF